MQRQLQDFSTLVKSLVTPEDKLSKFTGLTGRFQHAELATFDEARGALAIQLRLFRTARHAKVCNDPQPRRPLAELFAPYTPEEQLNYSTINLGLDK